MLDTRDTIRLSATHTLLRVWDGTNHTSHVKMLQAVKSRFTGLQDGSRRWGAFNMAFPWLPLAGDIAQGG